MNRKPLRILILTGASPRHLYVANRLSEAGEVLAIVQETGSHWTWRKVLRMLRPDTTLRKVGRWLRDRKRYTGGGEAKFFFGDGVPALDRADRVEAVPHINHPRVLELAEELKPDLICVFGTSLIRGALLSAGRLGMVNLHGGLSPEYRGADCSFWALYNGEPEKLGCTLHFIDAGIDTGGLIAHVRPPIHPGDDELTLFWRAVRESAAVYAELLHRLGRGERFGTTQPGKGRLYQVKDRGPRHEQDLAQRMQQGYPDLDLPLRVTWFTRPANG